MWGSEMESLDCCERRQSIITHPISSDLHVEVTNTVETAQLTAWD